MKSTESLSIPARSLYALTAPMMPSILGLMIGRVRPLCSAIVRNVRVIVSRFGRPKLILETPRTVLSPSSLWTRFRALIVSITPSCSAEAVRVRQSMNTSSRGIPYSIALLSILSAIAKRPSAVFGIPPLSSVRPTTAAPYFLTRGSIASSDSGSPFTEFTTGLPLYTLRPASRTSGLVESSCKGVSQTPCIALTAVIIISFSSIPGRPTLTSRISAPAFTCSTA